jgi:hypothetical protein
MDATLWIVAAVAVAAVVIAVVWRYGREFGLDVKGPGFAGRLKAKGDAPAKGPAGARNVSIGGDATHNLILTGDGAAGNKPAAGAGRNVSIGGRAEDNIIVTGDGHRT